MYHFQQLVVLTKLIWSMGFVFVGLNLIMWTVTLSIPSVFAVPQQFFGIDFVKENLEKVQAVVYEDLETPKAKQEKLIVLLGLSGASEGFYLAPINDQFDEQIKILSLCGAGRNMNEITIYANPLLESSLKPELVVFAISPFHLMDPPEPPDTFSSTVKKTPWPVFLMGWFLLKRQDVKHLIDMRVLDCKEWLYSIFGNQMVGSPLDPWRENTRMGLPVMETEEDWQENLTRYGDRGYYDIKNFQQGKQQITLFSHLIRRFQEKKVHVVIVWMPEHSRLSSKMPEEVTEVITSQLVQQLGKGRLPEIYDHRNSVPDFGFSDISHMNDQGKKAFTLILSEILNQLQEQGAF